MKIQEHITQTINPVALESLRIEEIYIGNEKVPCNKWNQEIMDDSKTAIKTVSSHKILNTKEGNDRIKI